jgi:predicted LPLAT superfamily acyltransferase
MAAKAGEEFSPSKIRGVLVYGSYLATVLIVRSLTRKRPYVSHARSDIFVTARKEPIRVVNVVPPHSLHPDLCRQK